MNLLMCEFILVCWLFTSRRNRWLSFLHRKFLKDPRTFQKTIPDWEASWAICSNIEEVQENIPSFTITYLLLCAWTWRINDFSRLVQQPVPNRTTPDWYICKSATFIVCIIFRRLNREDRSWSISSPFLELVSSSFALDWFRFSSPGLLPFSFLTFFFLQENCFTLSDLQKAVLITRKKEVSFFLSFQRKSLFNHFLLAWNGHEVWTGGWTANGSVFFYISYSYIFLHSFYNSTVGTWCSWRTVHEELFQKDVHELKWSLWHWLGHFSYFFPN